MKNMEDIQEITEDSELSACVSQLSRLNLAIDNMIPALSTYLDNSDAKSLANSHKNENFLRLIHDYRETHEWLRTMMMDQSMIVQCKREFIHFIDKMRDRLQYYNEEICFDYKNPHYADVSPANRERLMYIEQSLRDSIRDLEDWKKSLLVKEKQKQQQQQQQQQQKQQQQNQKQKTIKKSRIDAAIDKMRNRGDAITACVSKLRKTIHSIYDFHHMSFEFLCED